jgi:hypothetical protein
VYSEQWTERKGGSRKTEDRNQKTEILRKIEWRTKAKIGVGVGIGIAIETMDSDQCTVNSGRRRQLTADRGRKEKAESPLSKRIFPPFNKGGKQGGLNTMIFTFVR